MQELPNCPKCNSEYAYENGNIIVCPECAHEWVLDMQVDTINHEIIKDSNGNVLNGGDSIIVIKDLKVKGSSSSFKKGTKVKSIKLIFNASDGHDNFKDQEIGNDILKKPYFPSWQN